MRARGLWTSLAAVAVTAAMLGGTAPASADPAPPDQENAVVVGAASDSPGEDDEYLLDNDGDGTSDETVDLSDECLKPTDPTQQAVAEYETCVAEALAYGTRKAQDLVVPFTAKLIGVGDVETIVVKSSSGLPVSVKLTPRSACELRGTTVFANGTGTCELWAEQPGDKDWRAASAKKMLLTVTPGDVNVRLKLDSGAMNADGTSWAKRGASVTASVMVAGPNDNIVVPRGDVNLFIGGAQMGVGKLDKAARAQITFEAPKALGEFQVTAKYDGDPTGSYLKTDSEPQDLLVGLSKKKGAAIALTLDADPDALVVGQDYTFTTQVYPKDPRGKVTLTWDKGPTDLTEFTKGDDSVKISTKELPEGDYDVVATYTVSGSDLVGEDTVHVTVDMPSNTSGAVKLSTEPEPQIRVASKELTTNRDSAPEVRFFSDTATRAQVPLSLGGRTGKVLVRIEQPNMNGRPTTAGAATVLGNGSVLLPTMTTSYIGTFMIRVIAPGKDPRYLRVRVTPAPQPPAYPSPWATVVNAALEFVKTAASTITKMVPMKFEITTGVVNQPKDVADILLFPLTKGAALLQMDTKLAGPSEVQLAKEELQAELASLNTKLDVISAQINQLQGQLASNHCDVMTATLQPYRTKIASLRATYGSYVSGVVNAVNSATPGSQMTDADLKLETAWAQRASTEAAEASRGIQDALMGTDGSNGALAACAKKLKKDWEDGKMPMLGDKTYYEALSKYLQYFQDYQVLALQMHVDANHFLAWREWTQATPINPSETMKPELQADEVGRICSQPLLAYNNSRALQQYCRAEADEVYRTYDYMLQQLVKAGAGYYQAPSSQGAVSTSATDSNTLWVTDLSKYGDRSSCDGDLRVPSSSPNKVCGPTTGTDQAFTEAEGAGLGQTGWRVASMKDWTSVVGMTAKANATTGDDGTGSDSLRERMNRNGFTVAQDLIIYTLESVASNDPALSPSVTIKEVSGSHDIVGLRPRIEGAVKALCFIDTGTRVKQFGVCREPQVPISQYIGNVVRGYRFLGFKYQWTYALTTPPQTAYFTDPGFYGAYLTGLAGHGWRGEGVTSDLKIVVQPGWLQSTIKPAMQEFRWPVKELPTDKDACSAFKIGEGSTERTVAPNPLNVAGVRSMCGSDLAKWITDQIGTPPPNPQS